IRFRPAIASAALHRGTLGGKCIKRAHDALGRGLGCRRDSHLNRISADGRGHIQPEQARAPFGDLECDRGRGRITSKRVLVEYRLQLVEPFEIELERMTPHLHADRRAHALNYGLHSGDVAPKFMSNAAHRFTGKPRAKDRFLVVDQINDVVGWVAHLRVPYDDVLAVQWPRSY